MDIDISQSASKDTSRLNISLSFSAKKKIMKKTKNLNTNNENVINMYSSFLKINDLSFINSGMFRCIEYNEENRQY